MKIAEAIETALVSLGKGMTDQDMIAAFVTYKEHLRQAVLAEDGTNFIITYDDGSCIRITFGADHIKTEVGEDMEFRPADSKLSS